MLAEHAFEPLVAEGGLLATSVGQVIGVGPGRGIGLFIVVVGLLTTLVSVAAFFTRRLRRIELDLPDVEVKIAPETGTPAPQH